MISIKCRKTSNFDVATGDMVMLPKADAGSDDEGTGNDEGKIPSFCVLLHGGLKVLYMQICNVKRTK